MCPREVTTPAPGVSVAAMREMLPSLPAVEGNAMIGTPPAERAAPRKKSNCPPIPDTIRVPIESAQTWPLRSTCSAALMATTAGLAWMITGSFVRSQGWNSTTGLSSTKSNTFRVPATKLVTMRPAWTRLRRFVIAPLAYRSTKRSENISVCTPRSSRSPSRASTASGIAPIPICSVAPSGTSRAIWSAIVATAGEASRSAASYSGRSTCTKRCTRDSGTTVLPWVRGMRSLISAITTRAASTAARAASTEVPKEHIPCLSGGDSCTNAASSGTAPPLNRPGTSDRKMGT